MNPSPPHRRDARRAAEPAVVVYEERLAGRDVDRHDVAGQLGRERHHAGARDRLVVGEEQPAAAHYALQALHEPAAVRSAGAHVLRELDVRGHPGKLAVGGDHLLTVLQGDLEDRHRGALDFSLHGLQPTVMGGCPISASGSARGLALWKA
jgi:hypothetical protein